MLLQIWTKLSHFVCKYSRNISCKFYWNNWYGSLGTAVQTLKFTFSSDHTVAHWIFMNNKSNFWQLLINSFNVSIMNGRCLYLTLYLNRVFTMWLPTSCSNIRSKYEVNWYNGLINKLVKQIILYHRQNGLSAQNDVGQL